MKNFKETFRLFCKGAMQGYMVVATFWFTVDMVQEIGYIIVNRSSKK